MDALPRLEIYEIVVSENDLERITRVPRLRELVIATELSDKGLSRLPKFAGLRQLRINISTTTISRKGVQNVGLLSDLRKLNIDVGTDAVPSDYFAFLEKLHKLEELVIYADIKGDVTPYMLKLKKLQSLKLAGDADGKCIPKLSTLTSLKKLRYSASPTSPQFRDQVMRELEKMPFLRSLSLSPNLLKEGPELKRLKTMLPDTQIE